MLTGMFADTEGDKVMSNLECNATSAVSSGGLLGFGGLVVVLHEW
jgi:hypothetical protein